MAVFIRQKCSPATPSALCAGESAGARTSEVGGYTAGSRRRDSLRSRQPAPRLPTWGVEPGGWIGSVHYWLARCACTASQGRWVRRLTRVFPDPAHAACRISFSTAAAGDSRRGSARGVLAGAGAINLSEALVAASALSALHAVEIQRDMRHRYLAHSLPGPLDRWHWET